MHTTSQRLRYRFWLRVWERANRFKKAAHKSMLRVMAYADERMDILEFGE